jgi:fluoride ion exporter CrcB/FEX
MEWFIILIGGFIGGLIRGLFGFIKQQFAYKSAKFDWNYFLIMVFISGLVGILVASAFRQDNLVFCLVIGYAGGDFIENAYKIVFKRLKI